ncbi:Aerobic-type carbon monoxide dehydrogenase, small subunit CoxS/CutS-like protein [Pyrobaculum oguniense TE7]|uniref:Aerobic-type carbon monoxide dehydrogenase, small subunit CoxS/CutS-like protein n=1 Tax=Pyrobaculum oguniense (strain DSM 13380 / JCM 10595 / TE7) TaxID=698757 RepID=H6Q901_PYROT|nr:Aerobic-type carbon monoxide dehydrogenase, small subunit CoxS/CutS-like protein [Pyrobaculum oguniense TE7]
MRIQVVVNGVRHDIEVKPNLLLVHLLRDYLGLRSVRIGCDTSNCGACTVLLDGRPVKSCTLFAFMAHGRSVTTLEGLNDDAAEAIRRSFVEETAAQCGYCTSGMIISIYHLLKSKRKPTEEDVRHTLVGNLCRCTGYVSIIRAALKAARYVSA